MTGVLRWTAPGRHRPADIYRTLVGDATDSFWLDSGDDGSSFIGRGQPWRPGRPTLRSIRDELVRCSPEPSGFPLGLVGWLPYDLSSEILGAPARAPRAAAEFLRVDRGAHVRPDGSVELVAFGDAWAGEILGWRNDIRDRLSIRPPAPELVPAAALAAPAWRTTDDEYLELVVHCQEAIRDGDAYVLNLTTEARVEGRVDPVGTYLRLRAETPAHHAGLIRIGGTALVSASPEQFLAVSTDRQVTTRPVKGTRARAADLVQDAAIAAELGSSVKERAENLMIVDLMRNDLARVSDLADIAVTELFRVESYARIHQLVSTVVGTLRPGLDAIDAIGACFPAGSMTGAPKRSAIDILDRLERRARGHYAGAFGYLAADGRADLAMTIRTIVVDATGASIAVGGGITALSDPDSELAEMKLKAAALLRTLGF